MLQYAVDKAVDAVYWMRPDGGFDYVNDAAARMLGYTRDELLALHVWTINPNLSSRDWPKRFAEIKKGSRRSEVIEYTHRAKDGTLIKVEATTNYVRFGDEEFAFGFVRDVRERKLTEAALQMTQFAVDSASDAVYLLRPDGSFAYANDSASAMLGYSRSELESMAVFDINPDHTQQTFKRAFGRYKRKRGPAFVEQRHQAKDGRIVPVEISANYFSFGEQEGLFAFARDISERKATETSMRESEARYRSVVELSPDPILINCEGRIAFINSAGLEPLDSLTRVTSSVRMRWLFSTLSREKRLPTGYAERLMRKPAHPPPNSNGFDPTVSWLSWNRRRALSAGKVNRRFRSLRAISRSESARNKLYSSRSLPSIKPRKRFT